MTINSKVIINAIASFASASGHFDAVQGHEPKSAPGNGLTFAVFTSGLGPARGASGLNSTTARLELTGRVYKPFLSEPADLIDPALMEATDAMFTALAGDFELGGNVRNIDLQGASGTPLSMRAGYTTIDKQVYRTYDITIPIIVNDAWDQEA